MINNKKFNASIVIILYFLFFFYIPIFGQYFYFEEISSIYIRSQNYLILFIWISFVLLFFCILFNIFKKKNLIISRVWGKVCSIFIKSYINNRSIIILTYLFLTISYLTFELDFNSFRYQTNRISESQRFIYFYLILKTLVNFDIILLFVNLITAQENKITKKFWFNIIIVLIYFLLIGGIADTINLLYMVPLILFPKFFSNFLIYSNNWLFGFFKLTISLCIIFFGLLVAIYFGNIIKAGSSFFELDTYIGKFFFPQFETFFLYLIERISPYLHSLDFLILNQSMQEKNIFFIVLDSLQWRFSTILNTVGFSFEIQRLEFSGVSQYNFNTISTIIDDNQGTSPGAPATFVYLFGPFFGLFFILVYLIFISSVLKWIFAFKKQKKNYSFLCYLIILNLFQFFFQSPLDLINLFDNVAILNFLVLIYASANKYDYLNFKYKG